MKTQRLRGYVGGTLAVLLVMVAILVACNTTANVAKVAASPACPIDSLTDSVRITERGNLISHIALSDPIADIPEFHDCQRFPEVPGGQSYGSAYAIFAAFRLESLLARIPQSSDSVAWGGKVYLSVPVATIYTSDGTYPKLGIEPGFNCLFLYPLVKPKQGHQPSQWGAKMVPWGSFSNCGDHHIKIYPSNVGTTLEVIPSPPATPPFADRDYPANARWDQDSAGPEHIDITCGSAVCQVGEPGFHATGAYKGQLVFDAVPGMPATPAMERRVTEIKGWYDDQWLATVNKAGETTPSYVHGMVFPNPVLDTLSRTPLLAKAASSALAAPPPLGLKYFDKKWVHVAIAWLSADYGKWNLTKGVNKIYLCHGEADGCAVDLTQHVPGPYNTPLNQCHGYPTGDPPWWAKIISAKGNTAYACVRRTDHSQDLLKWEQNHPGSKVEIPGAVRWRWLGSDEGNWVGCPSGCCKY